MFYTGETPWHGMGQQLNNPATAAEAIQAAGLDWTVEKRPLFYNLNEPEQSAVGAVPLPDAYAVVNNATGQALGIVGEQYKPLQNSEAFSFFDPIVGNKEAVFHTAGALGKGEKIWILAKLPGHIRVIGDDIAEKYLLLANGHDGKLAVNIKFTPVRVVCQNTLTLALEGGKESLRFFHQGDMAAKMQLAHKLMGIVNTKFTTLESSFQKFARVQMNENRLSEYLAKVFPMPESGALIESEIEAITRRRETSELLFREGNGNNERGVAGTLWAALNGVTELVDHCSIRKEPNRNNKLDSSWFGINSRIKTSAYNAALDIALKA